jgi:DNA polymerase I
MLPGTALVVAAFRAVWTLDFEFSSGSGERPTPICMVAHELITDRTLRVWQDELHSMPMPPFPVDDTTLLVAFYASAELGCFEVLRWPMPANVLDLFTEFRVVTNGRPTPCGNGLLGALTYFGLDSIGADEKEAMRALALRGGPWTDAEKQALLEYCEGDVRALALLIDRMAPLIDLPRALLRGRYMRAAAKIEHTGVPVDVASLAILRDQWDAIQSSLIATVDKDFGVFEGTTFKEARFADLLVRRGIPWPRLPSGRLALDEDTFKDMSRAFPELEPLRQLRVSLSQMRLADLAVGGDGRNRTLLSAFRARTGRNQPSTTKFIFGPAVWLRSLILPPPGHGLAYLDYEQQEFAIAAALSGDANMMAAYRSGDPYWAFAVLAGAVPPDGQRQDYQAVRDVFKQCCLGVQYCMEAPSLAYRIGRSEAEARRLLELHRQAFPRFWRWSDSVVDYAMLVGELHTVYGWRIHIGPDTRPRSPRNFPMQAHGAEMLRVAACFVTEAGIAVCAPVHDALLIEAPLEQLDDDVARAQELMARASENVLGGFRLRSEAKLVRHPERYVDKRGKAMWEAVWAIISKLDRGSK